MRETLTCLECGVTWQREVARGRKPKLCKKCFKQNILNEPVVQNDKKSGSTIEEKVSNKISIGTVFKALHPTTVDPQKMISETKNGSKWYCQKCKSTLEVNVPLTDIPTHKCGVSSKQQYYERVIDN